MEQLLNCAMDIGEQMLVCGGEVCRAEESIKRMCLAFGAKRTDVFIITSSMVVTIWSEDEKSISQTRRISGVGTDIERLHRLNELSRRICQDYPSDKYNIEEIKKNFQDIMKTEKYPFWMEFASYAVIASAFSLFFGGGLRDAIVALGVGMILYYAVTCTNNRLGNAIFVKFIGSFVITAMAFGAVRLGIVINVDKVIIGNIMALIPGIGLTNALRDLFVGDSIAGVLRFLEAGLIALAIGAGYFMYICIERGLSL